MPPFLPAAVAALLFAGSPASAQPSPNRKPSLNIGAGIVGWSSLETGRHHAALVSAGTDIPVSSRWSVRIEAGQRIPRHRRSVSESLHYFYGPDPNGPRDLIRAFPVTRLTQIDETSLGDLSLFARFNSPPGDSVFEVAALGGIDLNWTRISRMTATPRSPTDLHDIEVVHRDDHDVRTVYALGMEAGRSFGPRWAVLAHGILGGHAPFTNDFRVESRAGVIIKRRF